MEPRVRIVHPTWDGEVLWVATGPQTPKARQLRKNPNVDIQYQVAPPEFVHVLVRGTAELVQDRAAKQRAWGAIDYDLTQFGSTGPADPNSQPVKITPTRMEISEMFGSTNKRIHPRCRDPSRARREESAQWPWTSSDQARVAALRRIGTCARSARVGIVAQLQRFTWRPG